MADVQGRAYSIWEAEGRPEGRDLEHWLQAERETEDGLPEDGPAEEENSAEAGVENLIEPVEEENPDVVGAASLVDSE